MLLETFWKHWTRIYWQLMCTFLKYICNNISYFLLQSVDAYLDFCLCLISSLNVVFIFLKFCLPLYIFLFYIYDLVVDWVLVCVCPSGWFSIYVLCKDTEYGIYKTFLKLVGVKTCKEESGDIIILTKRQVQKARIEPRAIRCSA